jgi:uncharacterized alkaline shock family protein YloU
MFLFINGNTILEIANNIIETILSAVMLQLVLTIGAIIAIVHNVQRVYNHQRLSFDE